MAGVNQAPGKLWSSQALILHLQSPLWFAGLDVSDLLGLCILRPSWKGDLRDH